MSSPIRISGLGEDRVIQPYPLDEVTIIGLGGTSTQHVIDAYADEMKREDSVKHETWTINAGCLTFKHDLCFNMHDLTQLTKTNKDEKQFIPLYKKCSATKLVTPRALEELPNSFEYPLHEVLQEFGQSYFANGISYIIAFALLCGAKKITLYGCDYNYAGRNAYEAGRCNVEFWLGIAAARGVEICIPAASSLCDVNERLNGKGAIGYGSVYGYFESQPQMAIDENGKLAVVAFSDIPPEDKEPIEGN